MGARISFGLKRTFGKKDIRIVMLGLDAAGKTTILYKLNRGEVVTTIPTIGFNVETVEFSCKSLVSFTTFDLGGRTPMRIMWRHYFQNCDALIFVVDSNDRDRIEDAREELFKVLQEEELRDVKVLVFANKQDLPGAMAVSELTAKLGLFRLRKREWFIFGSCAISGEGLNEGLDWLTTDRQTKKVDNASHEDAVPRPPMIPRGAHKKVHQHEKLNRDGVESISDTESTADTEATERGTAHEA